MMVKERVTNIVKIPLVREGATLLGLYWIYSLIRTLVARNSPYEAFINAYRIIDLEQRLGIFHEPNIQDWLIDHATGVVYIANTFYTIGYFPILVLCCVLLHHSAPNHFAIFKQTFLLGLGFALVCFSLFPLAPPRMLPGAGFVDTQQLFGDGFYNRKTVVSFFNPYAAMPSLHFGWSLLTGIMASRSGRRLLKILGMAYPLTMAATIVITGHHYLLDIAGGAVVIGLAYTLTIYLPQLHNRRSAEPVPVYGRSVLKPPLMHPPSLPFMDEGIFKPPSDLLSVSVVRENARSSFVGLLTNRLPPL